MPENTTNKTPVQQQAETSVSDSLVKGMTAWDKMTGSMIDTVAPGASQLDNLVSNFSNSSMLSNLLTSNSPTLNIKQGLEELCKFIVEYDWKKVSIGDLIDKFFNELGKLVKKVIKKITEQLIMAIYNAALKLRRMVISKLKSFLSEYVADACMSGLQDHLEDLMNPQNALSIGEFCSSVSDIVTDVGKNIDDLLKTTRATIAGVYNCLTGSAYSEAEAAYKAEELKLQSLQKSYIMMVTPSPLTFNAFDIILKQERLKSQQRLISEQEQKVAGAKIKMSVIAEKTIWKEEFWIKKSKDILQMLYEMACSRTTSYVQSEDFGLKAGIQDDIKKFMQGCAFQQALKTAKKIDPDGLSADVLGRISNLAQNGEMMDAYNIALAAGIDLSGSDFQIQLPSANGWVSKIYGDPFMFSPETPINASQIAKYLTDDMPSTTELLEGNINPDTASKPYVAENWSQSDSTAAAASNKLETEIDTNKLAIYGQESVGKTMSSGDGVAQFISQNLTYDANNNITNTGGYIVYSYEDGNAVPDHYEVPVTGDYGQIVTSTQSDIPITKEITRDNIA